MTTPALTAAAIWLRQYLAGQNVPVQAADVIAAGRDAGHAERSLRRAARGIGVVVVRRGFGGGTTWAVPAEPTPEPAPPTPSDAQAEPPPRVRVPVGPVDAFGRYRESVVVTSAQAASEWDARSWGPLR
jgi:hypothetical protein